MIIEVVEGELVIVSEGLDDTHLLQKIHNKFRSRDTNAIPEGVKYSSVQRHLIIVPVGNGECERCDKVDNLLASLDFENKVDDLEKFAKEVESSATVLDSEDLFEAVRIYGAENEKDQSENTVTDTGQGIDSASVKVEFRV